MTKSYKIAVTGGRELRCPCVYKGLGPKFSSSDLSCGLSHGCLSLFLLVSDEVSNGLSTPVPVLDGTSAFPRSCLCLSAIVLPQLVSHLVSQLVSLHVSPCGGVVSFAFFPSSALLAGLNVSSCV